MKEKIVTEQNIARFEKELKKSEKTPNTIHKYVRDVRKLQTYADGRGLTRDLMIAYKKELEEQGGYKANSINSFLTAINRFCIVMKWNDLCIKTIKVQRTAFENEEKELTMEEYKRMVSTASRQGEEKTARLLQTIAGTGIRVGELSYINVACLQNGMVDVHNKGKVRRILLPSALQELLKEYVQKHNICEGAVFQNRNHQPVDRREVWRRMKAAAMAAGVPSGKAFPHNLRHLFAREFYQQTGDIVKLADVLGHSSIDTTRIYVKSTGKEHKQQLDQMNMVVDHKDGGLAGNETVRITESGIILATAENVRVMADNTYLSQRILFPLEMMCFMSTLSGSDKKKWEQWYQKIEQSDNAAGSRKNRIFPTIL